MTHPDRLTVTFRRRTVGTLSLAPDSPTNVFEYDKSWLADGFSISPLELPLRAGVFIATPQPFFGNFGIFEDSLPDGYGRYLLHKALLRKGIDDTRLSSLDRLALVGDSGMGALCYSPAITLGQEEEITDFDRLQAIALDVLSEQKDSDAGLLLYNSGNSGGARPKAVFSDTDGHWLIKFRHTYDPTDIGLIEYRHNEAARACGITVPDFRLVNGRYFASRRFDIDADGNRIHTATAGALMGISLREPFMDYSNLLSLTGFITRNREDIEQIFKRMVFNYLTGNKDDHCKNFSFNVVQSRHDGTWQWRLAPAYDLTHCDGGFNGEHATSVNGTGRPHMADFMAVGAKIKLRESRCRQLIDEVHAVCAPLITYEI